MISISLPDGKLLSFEAKETNGMEIATLIGAGLARAAVATEINGIQQDLSDPIIQDASVRIITLKDEAGLAILRHTCAHLLAHALSELYPEAQMAIGPVIDNGFYYDIKMEKRLSDADLVTIETKMQALASQDYQVVKKMTPIQEARRLFTERGQPYKVAIIDALDSSIEAVGLYYHENYLDMCRGPHLPSMGFLKAFKLLKIAGAYWRGDSNNEMLQRIYGTCWTTSKDLAKYLNQLEESEKRDHRKLGKQMQLFFTDEVAPGMPFWQPDGTILYRIVEDYMRQRLQKYDYEEIRTPYLLSQKLWQDSGHWDKFEDMMFTTETEHRLYCVKPMNCPGAIQIYNQRLTSYRDFPIRMAEFGVVHRNEASGTLHGLMRVRAFTQDDAHIFCEPSQILDEIKTCIEMTFSTYRDFGFDQIQIKLSTRPPKRVGSDAIWDKAEQALAQALLEMGLEWEMLPGEGAFYGPKIEFSLSDCIGRVWQCGTIQLDFSMPERLGATYINREGKKETPVMIHRALFGSLERFIGILIEHYSGHLPLWLAPKQATILTVVTKANDYAKALMLQLKQAGIRVSLDERNEKINYKIREATLKHIPYQLIIGQKECENETISIRLVNGKTLDAMSISAFIQMFQKEMNGTNLDTSGEIN